MIDVLYLVLAYDEAVIAWKHIKCETILPLDVEDISLCGPEVKKAP